VKTPLHGDDEECRPPVLYGHIEIKDDKIRSWLIHGLALSTPSQVIHELLSICETPQIVLKGALLQCFLEKQAIFIIIGHQDYDFPIVRFQRATPPCSPHRGEAEVVLPDETRADWPDGYRWMLGRLGAEWPIRGLIGGVGKKGVLGGGERG
jgi:hypothetical protein